MKTNTDISFPSIPTTYDALIAFHPPRVIHDKTEFENTTAIVDAMAGHKLTKDQDDYLELLSQIIEAYENEHVDAPKAPSSIETLKFLLSENDMSGDDLADLLGVDRSQAFKILKGSRALTVDHIKKISDRFRISANVLLS